MPNSNLSHREWLIGLNASDQITRSALCRLGKEPAAWADLKIEQAAAKASTLGVPVAQLRKALALRPAIAQRVKREEEMADAQRCRILTALDPDYPDRLYDLPLPPPVLYVRGSLPTGPAIAIVGSRRLDNYGREVADCFARDLARLGVTIYSGFAIGVDTVAHRAALDEGGLTVAVLGCGLDVDYPRGREKLVERVSRQGALLSEFPFGAPPRRWHFPIRNRVIAALADSTLVIQATLRSGTLITAHHALELGRDVYAVPGSIFEERCLGTNALIADGALVARTPQDLLVGLPKGQTELFPSPRPDTEYEPPSAPKPSGLPGRILDLLPTNPHGGQTAEEVAAEVDKTVDQTLAALLELELAGWIRREPGPVYRK